MDKIVDHLFILEVMGGRRFPSNYSDLEPTKTAPKSKKKQSWKDSKQPNREFNFQRAKEYQK
jgi:hypothetical protein